MAAIETLAEHPEMGRIVPEFEQPALREMIRPPFCIVNRRNPQHVRVIGIWRSDQLLVLTEDGDG